MIPQLLDRLHLLDEGARSSGLIPQGDDGSRNLGHYFGDQLLPELTRSGPSHFNPWRADLLVLSCPGLTFHWQQLARDLEEGRDGVQTTKKLGPR